MYLVILWSFNIRSIGNASLLMLKVVAALLSSEYWISNNRKKKLHWKNKNRNGKNSPTFAPSTSLLESNLSFSNRICYAFIRHGNVFQSVSVSHFLYTQTSKVFPDVLQFNYTRCFLPSVPNGIETILSSKLVTHCILVPLTVNEVNIFKCNVHNAYTDDSENKKSQTLTCYLFD